MGKPQIPAGELGKIDVKLLPSGRYRARASTRNDSGGFHRPMRADMRRALLERSDLIEVRASAALNGALLAGEAWTQALGPVPRRSVSATWRQYGCTVAAYRDRYGIVGASALGPVPQSVAQQLDGARARAALKSACRLTEQVPAHDLLRPSVTVGLPPTGIQF